MFYNYHGILIDLHKEMMKVISGKQTIDATLDVLRRGLVGAMKTGKMFVINMDAMMQDRPDFHNEYTSGKNSNLFPA